MKEIIVRGWNKKKKRMEIPDIFIQGDKLHAGFFDNSGYPVENNNIILMQYIGLNDKNDIKIYEGDIVEAINMSHDKNIPDKWIGEITQGKFNGCWQITKKVTIGYTETKSPVTQKQSIPIFKFMNFNCGVIPDMNLKKIGNIYENPEIIKEIK